MAPLVEEFDSVLSYNILDLNLSFRYSDYKVVCLVLTDVHMFNHHRHSFI